MRGLAVDVLWTARYDYGPKQCLAPHCHDYFQMIYFLGGKGVFRHAAESVATHSGLLALIKPNVVHSMDSQSVVKTLDLKFRVANRALRKQLLVAPGVVSVEDPAVPILFERIRFEGERKLPYCREMCGAPSLELMLLYLRQESAAVEREFSGAQEQAVQNPFLRKALAYIHNNYSQPISIASIGVALRCSERTVRLHFQQGLGVRPLIYLQRYRVAQAKKLIEFSDYGLKRIAALVGFKTVQHFTRIFTAQERITPGEWRRKYREGIRKDVNIDPAFLNPSWKPNPADLRGTATLPNAVLDKA